MGRWWVLLNASAHNQPRQTQKEQLKRTSHHLIKHTPPLSSGQARAQTLAMRACGPPRPPVLDDQARRALARQLVMCLGYPNPSHARRQPSAAACS